MRITPPGDQSAIYNVKLYGAVGNGSTDDSTAIQAAIDACGNASGGTVYFPPATYRMNSQLTFPTDGASPPRQRGILLLGASGSMSGGYGGTGAVYGGTVLDLRHAVGREFSDGVLNSTTTITSATAAFTSSDIGKGVSGTGIPASTTIASVTNGTTALLSQAATATATGVFLTIDSPKIDTRGGGLLAIESMTLKDGGSASSCPFIRSTFTVLRIRDVTFQGSVSVSGISCKQDAIILGGVDTVVTTNSPTAGFQGYGSTVTNCYFANVRRCVYGRTFANGNVIRDNHVELTCGGTTTAAAFELDGGPAFCNGNVFAGNLVEQCFYPYTFRGTNASQNAYRDNNLFDPTAATLAHYRFEAGGYYNLVVDGFHDDSKTAVSEATAVLGSNTRLTSHQNRYTTFSQPVEFLPSAFAPRVRKLTSGPVSSWQTQNLLGDVWDESCDYTTAGLCNKSWRVVTASRTVTDGVLNTTTTLTSATAAFVNTDLGRLVTATGVPVGTTVAAVPDANTITLSAAATATASGVTVTIGGGTETLLTLQRASTTQTRLNFAATVEARIASASVLRLYAAAASGVVIGDSSNNLVITNGILTATKGMTAGRQALTYSTSITPAPGSGAYMIVIVTDGVAFTINNPSATLNGQFITFDIKNSSGGAMGAITWGGLYLLAGAFTNPASTKRRTITFGFDGSNWVEQCRAAADI